MIGTIVTLLLRLKRAAQLAQPHPPTYSAGYVHPLQVIQSDPRYREAAANRHNRYRCGSYYHQDD